MWSASVFPTSAIAGLVGLGQQRRPTLRVMGIGRKDHAMPLAYEPFPPVLHALSKAPGQRPGGDLEPDSPLAEALHHSVVTAHPAQSLRMGDDRDQSGGEKLENLRLEPRRRNVMRGSSSR